MNYSELLKPESFNVEDVRNNTESIDPNNKEEFVSFAEACIKNKEELVKQFIKKGIDVNCLLDDYADGWVGYVCIDYTPLYLSVKYLSVEVVETLLKHQADLTFQDKNGNSPLQLAYYTWKNRIRIPIKLKKPAT